MKGQTQKDKILALLQSEERISQPRVRNIGEGYRDCIADLRAEGYDIRCVITLDGTFYQLNRGENDGSNTNVAAQLQAA